jgi:hypothetical protein
LIEFHPLCAFASLRLCVFALISFPPNGWHAFACFRGQAEANSNVFHSLRRAVFRKIPLRESGGQKFLARRADFSQTSRAQA